MKISFFEEFPTEENLKKLDLLDFPVKLYIAAESLEKFKKIKRKIPAKKVEAVIYWPVLKYEEGYWLSPFAKRKALFRVMEEVVGMDFMWDAEMPKKRSLLITNFHQFFMNRAYIKTFFKKHKGQIYTAEYFPEKGMAASLLKILGMTFNPNKYGNKVIKMAYSSMHDHGESFIKKEAKQGVKDYGDKFLMGLGTIAIGIRGDEPILEPKKLERDLRVCRDAGVEEVVVFRLAGLTEEYVDCIKKFR